MESKRFFWRFLFGYILTIGFTHTSSGQVAQELLDSLIVSGDVRCGSGILNLQAASPLEGDSLLRFNWYEQGDTSEVFLGSFEKGNYITPSLLTTQTYYVSAAYDGVEGRRYTARAEIQNTVRIREAPRIGLCGDEVTLNAITTFSADDLVDATYRWQRFSIVDEEAAWLDVSSGSSTSLTTTSSGFFRVIVTSGTGCEVISQGMETTTDVIVESVIVAENTHCYGQDAFVFSSEYTRDIAEYLWEVSYDNVSFATVGTAQEGEIAATNIDLPLGMDSRTMYLRLTVKEQPCEVSSTLAVQIQRLPTVEISRLGSTDSVFTFCGTDPAAGRTLTATQTTSIPGTSLQWYRLTRRLSEGGSIAEWDWEMTDSTVHAFASQSEEMGEFQVAGTNATLVLEEGEWGWYVCKITEPVSGCFSLSNVIFANSAVSEQVDYLAHICEFDDEKKLKAFSPHNQSLQWSYHPNSPTGPFDPLTGETDRELTLTTPDTDIQGYYYLDVEVTSPYGNTCTSGGPEARVNEDTFYDGSASATAEDACPGGTVLLEGEASSSVPDLYWQRSSDNTSFLGFGVQGNSANVQGGYYYRLRINNGACNAYSDTLFVGLETSPTTGVTYDVADPNFCSPVTISAVDDAATNDFQWYYTRDSINIVTVDDGNTSSTTTSEKGYYYARIENEFGCTSYTDTTFMFGNIVNTIDGYEEGQNICLDGETVFLQLQNDVTYSYEWYYAPDGSSAFVEASGLSDSSRYGAVDEGLYFAVISNGDCVANTDTLQAFDGPDLAISRLGSSDDFFFCGTDPEANRTFQAVQTTSFTDVTFHWERFWRDDITQDSAATLVNDGLDTLRFDSLGTGTSWLITDSQLGWYRSILTANTSGCTATSPVILANTVQTDIIQLDAVLCPDGDSSSLYTSYNDNDTYQWQYADNALVFSDLASANDDTLQVLTPVFAEGSYRLTTSKNGCAAVSDTAFVQWQSLPTVVPLLDATTICSDEQAILSMTLPNDSASYYWQYSVDGVSYDSLNSDSLTIAVTDAGFYRALLQVDGCQTTSATVELSTNPAPGTSVTYSPATTTFCDPVEISLVDQQPDYTYRWYFYLDSGEVQPIDAEDSPRYTASSAGNYFATIEAANGCASNSDTTQLRTQIDPTILGIDDEIFLCDSGSSVLLETASGTSLTYDWLFSADSVFSTVSADSLSSTYRATGEGFYKVRVSNGTCVEESQPIELKIDTTRLANFTSEISSLERYCDNEEVTFTSVYDSPSASYSWQYAMGEGAFEEVPSNDAPTWVTSMEELVTENETSYDLKVRLTIGQEGCFASSETHETTLFQSPDLEIVRLIDNSSEGFVYCPTDTELNRRLAVRQGDTDYFPLTYQWELLNTTGSYENLPGDTLSTLTLSDQRGSLRVTSFVPDFEACASVSNNLFVERPSDSFLSEDVFLCESHPYGLLRADERASDTSLTDVSYRWFYSAGDQSFGAIGGEDGDSLIINPIEKAFGAGNYYFEATKSGCSVLSDTIEVTIRPKVPFSFITIDEFCSNSRGGTIKVVIQDESAYRFALDSVEFVATTVFDSLNVGTYRVSALDSIGCVSTNTAEVFAVNNFEVFLEPDTLAIQQGIPFDLEATGAVSYQWFPEEYVQSSVGASVTAYVPPDAPDTLVLVVEGESPEGCFATDTVLLIQEQVAIETFEPEELIFSKVISPNGDRINDEFEVIGLPVGLDSQLQILDRWGKVIFSARNYDAGSSEGKDLSERLKEGTYFYLLTTSAFTRKGHFQVLRQ